MIYVLCSFKTDGLIAIISMVAAFGIWLLLIRYTSTKISLNSIAAVILVFALEAYLIIKLLGKIKKDTSYENTVKSTLRVYVENIEIIVISLIIAIIFTFMNKTLAYSFGMTLFYGIISMAISNLVFLRTMLLAKYSNK